MVQRDVIVVGASAGGVEALKTLLGGLPADLPACVLVVLHMPASGINALAPILARATELRVRAAGPQMPLTLGTVVVGQPDHHLLITDAHVQMTRGPRENGHRPSVDVLFRSAARALGPRVIGVVLTGSLDDGSAGLLAVRRRGGIGVVQDPEDAQQPGMPSNAIVVADPEYVLPVAAMPELLADLVTTPVVATGEFTATDLADGGLMDTEVALAQMRASALQTSERPGVPAGFSCPDCAGTLFAIDDAGYVRYRCRVGHAWSPQSLLAEHGAALEGALWMALRGLEEKAALVEDLARRSEEGARPASASRFREQAVESREAAELIRRMLTGGTGAVTEDNPLQDRSERRA